MQEMCPSKTVTASTAGQHSSTSEHVTLFPFEPLQHGDTTRVLSQSRTDGATGVACKIACAGVGEVKKSGVSTPAIFSSIRTWVSIILLPRSCNSSDKVSIISFTTGSRYSIFLMLQ